MTTVLHKTNSSFTQKLFSGIIWRAGNVLVAFIFNAILVHQIGAHVSSSFFYMLNNLFFAALLLGLSLESGIGFYCARKEISQSHLFSISIVWSIAGAVVFFAASHLFRITSLQLTHTGLLMSIYVCGSLLTSFLSSIYYANHNSRVPNLVITFTNIILILLLPRMPWMDGKMDFDNYILYYLCSTLLSSALLTFFLMREKIVFSFSALTAKILKPLFIFSLHAFVLGILFNLLKRSDFWLVKRWCSPNDAGNYFQASKIIQLVLLIPALASFSLYPLVVESIKKHENTAGNKEIQHKVLQLVGLYFCLALFFGFGIIVFGHWIFPLLYGSTFGSLYYITLFLIPGLVCFAATFPLTVFFSGKKQNHITIRFLGIAIIVLLVCNVVLTPSLLIYGAAISNSVANMAFFLLLMRKFLEEQDLPFSIKSFTAKINMGAIFKNPSSINE